MSSKVSHPCFDVLKFIFECTFNVLNASTIKAFLAIFVSFNLIMMHRFMNSASIEPFTWHKATGTSIPCMMLDSMI